MDVKDLRVEGPTIYIPIKIICNTNIIPANRNNVQLIFFFIVFFFYFKSISALKFESLII